MPGTTQPSASQPSASQPSASQPSASPPPVTLRKLTDPALASFVEAEYRQTPTPAGTTEEPNRLTFVVPTDTTVLSLGAASSDTTTITDRGIRGHTDEHIQWYTRKTPSYVRLGEPSSVTTSKLESEESGYVLSTDGSSRQTTKKDTALIAEGHTLLLHASGAGAVAHLDAPEGAAELTGGEKAVISGGHKVTITAGTPFGSIPLPGILGEWAGKSEQTATWAVKKIMGVMDVYYSAQSLAFADNPLTFGAEQNSPTWKSAPTPDNPKRNTDFVKLVASTQRLLYGVGPDVSIAASSGVSLSADYSASIYGGASASVTSALSAGLLGATASVKAIVWASVWAGKDVSVKGRNDAKIDAEKGKASIKGNAGVEVSSYKGPAIVQGNGATRVSSVTDTVYVYGNKGVSIASGPSGPGFVLNVTGTQFEVGPTGAADGFKAPPKLNDDCLMIGNQPRMFLARISDSDLAVGEARISLRVGSNTVNIDSNNVTVDADRIQFG